MSPDLLYFLNLTTVHRGLSHSWLGLFLFCLPAGVAFSFAFHRLFKFHFLTNLPSPLDRVFSGLAVSSWGPSRPRDWLILIVSVLIGALSHFFWDSFTHGNGVLARFIPIMSQAVTISGKTVCFTTIAQHLSTATGLLFIAQSVVRGWLLPKPSESFTPRSIGQKLIFWAAVGAISAGFATAVMWIFVLFLSGHPVGLTVIWGLSSWAGGVYAIAVYTVIRSVPVLRARGADSQRLDH